MNRRLTITLAIIISAVSAMAQKLNWQGLKMVKSIEIENYLYDTGGRRSTIYRKGVTFIDLGYNDTRLTSMNIKFSFEDFKTGEKWSSHTESYQLRDGQLTRTDHYRDENTDNSIYWKYQLDNGIITKIEEYSPDTNGGNGCLRTDYNIRYITDENGRPIINGVLYEWYIRLRGTTFFQKGEDAQSFTRFRYNNGDLDYHTFNDTITRRVRWEDTPFDKYISYNDVINDTNINWTALIFSYGLGGRNDSLNDRYLTLTEWLPCRSKHLLTHCERWEKQDMSYTFEGDNIVRIDLTSNGKLQRTVRIKYVE